MAKGIGIERLSKVPASLSDKLHSPKQSGGDASDDIQTDASQPAPSMRPSTLPGFWTDPTEDEDGMEVLFKGMKKMVFPQTTHESRDLHKEYTKPGHIGILAGQSGEAMHFYVARKMVAWQKIRELDDKVMLSIELGADMLLEAANISKAQQQITISSISKERDSDKIADALIF